MAASIFVHDTGGDGPALVLVHAFPLNSDLFAAQRALADDLRLVTLDLPGFGRSAPPAGPGTMGALAGAVCRAMDQVGLQRATLCGVSIGGYILLELMRRCPERVEGLVLCDTRAEADPDEIRAARADGIALADRGRGLEVADGMVPKLLCPDSYARPALRVATEAMASTASDRGIAFALQAMRDRPDSRPGLGEITAPTLVVVGEQDALTPPDLARVMSDGIPGARLEVVPGAGHLTPLEQPERFNALVREFMARPPLDAT